MTRALAAITGLLTVMILLTCSGGGSTPGHKPWKHCKDGTYKTACPAPRR